MHKVVGYATVRALAISRKPVQDIQRFLEPFPRGAQRDLHLDVLVARVEEIMHLARRHSDALAGRQHDSAGGLGVDAHVAFFGREGFRVGAVPVRRVPTARRDGYAQQGVLAVGLAAIFLKDGLVFCDGCPDSAAGVCGHPGWDLGDIFGFDVAREFGIHIAMR